MKRTGKRAPLAREWARSARLALACALALTVLAGLTTGARSDALRAAFARPRLAPQLVGWSNFSPTGFVLALPATASVTATTANGLDTATAEYALSTDAGASWSSWRVDNLSVTGAVSTTQTLTVGNLYLPTSATRNLIRFRITETGGASEQSQAYTIPVDTTAPGAPLNLTVIPGGWTNLNSFTVSWTTPVDDLGIIGSRYTLNAPPVSSTDGTYSPTTDGITGISVPSDGVHTVYVWLVDAAGRANLQATATGVLQLDRVPPAAPYAFRAQPAYTWTNVNSFSETWTNPSDTSGIVAAYYQVGDLPGTPGVTPIRVDSANGIANIGVPGDGKHSLYVWLVDGAGNSSTDNWGSHPQVFWYDGAAPTSSVLLSPAPASTGWYTSTVTAAFNGEDQPGLSGLQAVYWQLDGAAAKTTATTEIAAEGSHKLVYYGRDNAGNLEWARQVDFMIDRTAPTTSLTASSQPQLSGWYTSTVSFTLNVWDGVSGPSGGFYRINGGAWQNSTTFTLANDGIYQVEYYGQDLAGNQSPIGTLQVKMDAQTPSTAYQIEGSQGSNGWYVSPLTVKLIATDGGSGVTQTYYRINNGPWQTGTQFPLTSDGIYSLSFYSVDASGNRETSFPVEVKLDTAAPAAPAAVETIPSGWSRTNNFTVKWANPTDQSGLAGVYYRLNQEPAHAKDGTFAPLTARLDGLTVPTEGVHRLYLWLQDGAGNASTSNKVQAPLLRYDATAPDATATVQGPGGQDGWYRGAVTVTLKATDGASGVRVLNYRINAGQWVTATQTAVFSIMAADKHVIEFNAEDVAGNASALKTQTVRIDLTAPPALTGLTAIPQGWHRFNNFGLTWLPLTDQSGIAGVYVKSGAAPTGPSDGTFYAGAASAGGITVPGEGKHTLWVWPRDGAGNADHRAAVALSDAVWYDGVPPVTVVTRTGTLGLNGWYRTPVSFTVSATDTTSGVAEIRYQVDDDEWQQVTLSWGASASGGFAHAIEGVHTLRVAAVDSAGNPETPQVFNLKVDTRAPQSRLILPQRQQEPSFEVGWAGEDIGSGAGSGLLYYDVYWRDGYNGPWQGLKLGTKATSSPFTGERGHTYFFRVSAVDAAGNRQEWPATGKVLVEPVLNGAFDTGTFDSWSAAGILYKAVIPVPGPTGAETQVARLGTDDYGPSLTDPGSVPVGSATISQELWIPDASQLQQTCLTFAYRVFSYDVMYSQRLGKHVDTLDVTLNGAGGETLLLRAGNPTNSYGALFDSGWRQARFDLRAWAGQTVTLSFANNNRNDNLFNTWSYVDDVRVGECRLAYLPLTLASGVGAAQVGESAVPARDATPADGLR